MAVDPEGKVTETPAPFTIGDTRVVFGVLNLGGINLDSVIMPSAAVKVAELKEKEKEKRYTDSLITTVLEMLNDPFFTEETNKFVDTLWQSIKDNGTHTTFDILAMNDEELYALIKEDKKAWDLYIDNLQQKYPHVSRENIENAALERIATKLRDDAKLEVENRIERANAKALETMEQGLAMAFNINQNVSPQEIVDQLQNSIDASQADFDGMVELAQEMQDFLKKHGPNPELAVQLDALDAAMERQSALITFNVEIKAFFDTHHEEFPSMTAEQIMVRAMVDKDLMEAYADFSQDIDPEKLQQIALQAGERLGLTPEDVEDYFALMEKTQAAANEIQNTIAKLSMGSRAVFDTKIIGTDGLDEFALIFRGYNHTDDTPEYITINYRTGAENIITDTHIISAIQTAEADPDYKDTLKVGHPDEMMALRKAFYDAWIIELQRGMAQQEAIAKAAHQTESEQTEIETPEMTPDEVQKFITENKTRILAIFEANPDGISPDMLKYGLALLGLQPGNDLNRAMSIVSNMPEANIIDPAASKEFNPVAMTAAPTTPSMS